MSNRIWHKYFSPNAMYHTSSRLSFYVLFMSTNLNANKLGWVENCEFHEQRSFPVFAKRKLKDGRFYCGQVCAKCGQVCVGNQHKSEPSIGQVALSGHTLCHILSHNAYEILQMAYCILAHIGTYWNILAHISYCILAKKYEFLIGTYCCYTFWTIS